MSGSLIETAPSGVSAYSGPSIGFTHAPAGELGIKARIPLCTLAQPLTGGLGYLTDSIPGMLITANTGSVVAASAINTLALSPLVHAGVSGGVGALPPFKNRQTFAAFSDCNFLALIGQAFSKYSIKNFKLSYLPTTTTVDPVNFSLAFTDDPMHPVLGMDAYTTTASSQPTYNTTKNSVNSVAFAAWSTWERAYKVDPSTVYYTGASLQEGLQFVDFKAEAPFEGQDLRFSHFGAISVLCNSTNAVANAPKGELYMEIDMVFFDMVPVSSVTAVPYTLLQYLKLADPKGVIFPEEEEMDEEKGSSVFGRFLHRSEPRAGDSGHYRIIGQKTAAVKRKGAGPARQAPVKRLRVHAPASAALALRSHPEHAMVKVKHNRITLLRAITHLHRCRAKLPPSAQKHVGRMVSLAAKKSRGWKDTAKDVMKTVVKDVPVVGGILAELTDSVGGKLLDWIGSLF
jgi:hypothetical protein